MERIIPLGDIAFSYSNDAWQLSLSAQPSITVSFSTEQSTTTNAVDLLKSPWTWSALSSKATLRFRLKLPTTREEHVLIHPSNRNVREAISLALVHAQIWNQLCLLLITLEQSDCATQSALYCDTTVLVFRLAVQKAFPETHPSARKRSIAAAVNNHFADIRPPECMFRTFVSEICFDMVFELVDHDFDIRQQCTTPLPKNIECKNFVDLLDAAIRKSISADGCKIDPTKAKMERDDLVHRLDELVPSIWRPGYATAVAQLATFVPTLANAFTSIAGNPGTPSTLKAKITKLCNKSMDSSAADQSVQLEDTSFLRTRLLALIQRCLSNGNTFTKLKLGEKLKPITLGTMQQVVGGNSDLEDLDCFADLEHDNDEQCNSLTEKSETSLESPSTESDSLQEDSQSLEIISGYNLFVNEQPMSDITLHTSVEDHNGNLSCHTVDDYDDMSMSSLPDCYEDVAITDVFQRPRGSSVLSTLPDVTEPFDPTVSGAEDNST